MNYVDLHSHLLPALDDGAASFEESLALLETAWGAGTRHMVATPHMYQAGLGSDDPAAVARLFAEFEARLDAYRSEKGASVLEGLELTLGAENYVGEEFLNALEKTPPGVLTLGDSRYLLMEFWPLVTATSAAGAINAVQDRGFVPVLAHVERYGFLQNDPERLGQLVAAGAVAQVNAAAILGRQGLRAAQLAAGWLRGGLIAVVASDGHDTQRRPPQLDEVAGHLRSRHGSAVVEHCLRLNPLAILADEPVSLPSGQRRRWWHRQR